MEKLDLEVRQRILVNTMRLFERYGVRSVTMDDVAREVSMSKKTLYQYFVNKDGLVTAVAKYHIEEEREDYSIIAAQAANAIDELHQIAKCMRKNIQDMNPNLLYDLKKFHFDAWNIYLDFKHQFVRGNIEDNLKRGIQEGFYRPEIDVKVLATFRMEQVEMIFDTKIFPPGEFNFADVQLHLFDHFVHGILTEKGRQLYQEYLKIDAKTTLK